MAVKRKPLKDLSPGRRSALRRRASLLDMRVQDLRRYPELLKGPIRPLRVIAAPETLAASKLPPQAVAAALETPAGRRLAARSELAQTQARPELPPIVFSVPYVEGGTRRVVTYPDLEDAQDYLRGHAITRGGMVWIVPRTEPNGMVVYDVYIAKQTPGAGRRAA